MAAPSCAWECTQLRIALAIVRGFPGADLQGFRIDTLTHLASLPAIFHEVFHSFSPSILMPVLFTSRCSAPALFRLGILKARGNHPAAPRPGAGAIQEHGVHPACDR